MAINIDSIASRFAKSTSTFAEIGSKLNVLNFGKKQKPTFGYSDFIMGRGKEFTILYLEYLLEAPIQSYFDRLPIIELILRKEPKKSLVADYDVYLNEILPRKIVLMLAKRSMGKIAYATVKTAYKYTENKKEYDAAFHKTLDTLNSKEFSDDLKKVKKNFVEAYDLALEKIEDIAEKMNLSKFINFDKTGKQSKPKKKKVKVVKVKKKK